MKLMHLFLTAGILFSASSFGACLDITGDYESGAISQEKGNRILSFRQNGCDSISTGSYYLKGADKVDEASPRVNMTHVGKEALCEARQCLVFQGMPQSLAFSWDGFVTAPDRRHACRSLGFEVSIRGQDLVKSFSISDASPYCKGLHTMTVSYKRIR